MLYRFLIIILLIDAIVLMAAVLLQSGKGGGLAASFGGGGSGGDALFGARQAGNLLTKVTWWSAGIFLGIAFIMQITSARTSGPTSILDQAIAPAPPVTAPPAAAGGGTALPLTVPAPTTPPAGQTPPAKKQP
jgi:preprotein translocase subunit SecG